MSTAKKPTSSISLNEDLLDEACAFNKVIRLLSPQWKMQILFSIHWGANRFSLLKKEYASLSDQILGKRIKELEDEGFISKVSDPVSKRANISYHLTPKAKSLLKIVPVLCNWGERWL